MARIYFTPKSRTDQLEYKIDDILEEIEDARSISDDETYGTLGEALRAAIATAQDYADEAAANSESINTYYETVSQDDDGNYVLTLYEVNVVTGEETVASQNTLPAGGGGGGGTNNATLTFTNATGWLANTVSSEAECKLSVYWTSLEDDIETGDGTLTVKLGSTTKTTLGVSQGTVTVDVSDYLSTGSNKIKLTIEDVYGNSRTITYTITVVELSLTSSFDYSTTYTAGETVAFTCTPVGSVSKTIHYVVDGEEVATATVTTSGRQITTNLPAMEHGSHTLSVYFTATIDDTEVQSNTLYFEILVVDSTSTTPIIASSFTDTSVAQYDTLNISYIVYTPSSLTSAVELYANDELVSELTVDRTEQTWAYRPDETGTLELKIVSGETSKSWILTVTDSEIDAEAETDSLALYLTSYGRSNSENDPSIWEDTDNGIAATLTDFNYTSDGWVLDDDGVTVLRVSGDARVEIPLQIFANDFRSTGKTIEIEFETHDVRNYDSAIVSCVSGGRGLELTAQSATLTSEQSSVEVQYKEDEHVRLTFVVEKRSENRLIYVYTNGSMGASSGIVQYPSDDDFSQSSPVDILIGSNDCTVDIYAIRVYDNDLTRYQVLNNWIADTQNADDMIERYNHNNVYDEYGSIVIDQLPSDLPYLVFQCDALPSYKGNKLTVSGYYIDPSDSSKNFTFVNCTLDVQGTTSAGYARKNFKGKFSGGFTNDAGETSSTYQLRDDSIPTKTFTFKADVASSEGANNVELVRLYNEICPYQTPPQKEDNRIRQGIDGFPIVIFHDNGTTVTFIGKYNFNNDKGTEEVYGFEDGDESWEILNNTSDRVIWKSADFSGDDWMNDFEARYPEDNTDTSNLAAFSAWLVSTDTSSATDKALSSSVTYDGTTYTTDSAAYRLAKFKAELEDYCMLDSAVFYYLFTELFLMVDSRAKNAFPTRFSEDGKFCWFPYDMDTAIGINNEGTLAFSYNLEDIDALDTGADVYNGQQSVMWTNLRAAFYDEIQSMYQELRSDGVLSYDIVEEMFEEHQAKWPEAIVNEDSYYKYIEPLINDGTSAYLSMAQGLKILQRKWWLYNRFKYMDSKYNAGDALSDIITLRGYAKDDITITPYADIYASIKYGSYLVQERATRNASYTLACPLDNVNDTEIYIYSCSQLADVGDLSGLKVGYANFQYATKLVNIKIGDESSDYTNGNLTELYLGNNTLLQTVDVRNCPNLASTIDLSGCTGIEEVYFGGTSITGVTLPNGGVLKVLQLPSTVTNLTIRNQTAIETFEMPSYENISTLRLENVSDAVDMLDILSQISANSRVRLTGWTWEIESEDEITSFCDYLDTMRGLDENGNNVDTAQVSGTIYIDTITGATLADLQSRYPYITVIYNHITSNVYFYNYDGSSLLYTVAVSDGASVASPGSPSRSSSAQYTYTFAGWSFSANATSADSNALTSVTADRVLYAAYSQSIRYYTVYFYNGSTLLQTVSNVPYGGSATYTGDTPVTDDPDNYGDFTGWSPSPSNITGNTSCYAQFAQLLEVAEIEDDWATIIANVEAGNDVYNVGNYKALDLGTEGTINMQIVGRNKDTLADGSGTALYSWNSMELLTTSHRMNPSLVTNYDYKEQTATSATNSNTSVSANSSKTTSFRTYIQAGEVATITNTVTATADGTLTITYAGLSSSYGKLTVTVNGEDIVTDYTSSTAVAYTMDVTSGDVVTIVAEYTSAVVSSSSASIKLASTGTFTLTTDCNSVMVRYESSYDEGTGAIGGWEKSEMRTYVQETIMPLIPDTVLAGIKEVTKSQPSRDTAGTSETQTTTDKVWIPSYAELFGSSSAYYSVYQNTSANRIKYKVGASSASFWWLRTAYGTTYFYYVYTSGSNGNNGAGTSYGVCLGFCT